MPSPIGEPMRRTSRDRDVRPSAIGLVRVSPERSGTAPELVQIGVHGILAKTVSLLVLPFGHRGRGITETGHIRVSWSGFGSMR
jgi:hypothetical protein